MDASSNSKAATFRYVPVAGSPKKVWRVEFPDGTSAFYWWVVEWDLPNISQHAGRRQCRWEHLLERAGWAASDGQFFQPSNLTVLRRPQAFSPSTVSLFEQSIRTESLIFLLASGAQCRKGTRTVFKRQLAALAQGSFLEDAGQTTLQGEISIGTPSCTAACPFLDGRIDTQVIEALAQQGYKPMQQLWGKMRHLTSANACPLEEAICLSYEIVGASEILCKSVAELICQALEQHWTQLSSDPLFSRVQPRQASKANARYDPDLKNAIADAVRGGPATMQILDRVFGQVPGKNFLKVQSCPRASRMDEESVCRYYAELKRLAWLPGATSIAIAIDGARVGGKKLLSGPIMFCSTLKCAWLLPQIMRDFRASLDGTLSSSDVEECLIGLRCFLGSLARGADLTWQQSSGSEKFEGGRNSANSSRAPRIAALDLGHALESTLQSTGLSLSNFACCPEW